MINKLVIQELNIEESELSDLLSFKGIRNFFKEKIEDYDWHMFKKLYKTTNMYKEHPELLNKTVEKLSNDSELRRQFLDPNTRDIAITRLNKDPDLIITYVKEEGQKVFSKSIEWIKEHFHSVILGVMVGMFLFIIARRRKQ